MIKSSLFHENDNITKSTKINKTALLACNTCFCRIIFCVSAISCNACYNSLKQLEKNCDQYRWSIHFSGTTMPPNNRCCPNIKDHYRYMAKDNTSLKNRLITLPAILQRQSNVITILMFVSSCQSTTLKKTKARFYIPKLSGHRSSRMLTSLEP